MTSNAGATTPPAGAAGPAPRPATERAGPSASGPNAGTPEGRNEGGGNEQPGEGGDKKTDDGGEEGEKPSPLDPVFDFINPARAQRRLDGWFGRDPDAPSTKPAVPELGEPVFFDLSRPLGASRYSNELNYLYNVNSRNAPALQVLEYEYAFADWRSAELDLSYYNGNLQILTPFYQRTLGVGPRGNWAHGYQLSADVYTRSGNVGGSTVYVFGWKPERDSRFSTLTFLGANRALIGDFTPGGGSGLGSASGGMGSPGTTPGLRRYMAWRPTLNADFFYRVGEKVTLGLENDLFFGSGRAGEYLVLPFVTIETGEHAFFQFGTGYYHFEGGDQFSFFAHINIVNPSTKRKGPLPADDEGDRPGEGGDSRTGRLRRRLGRWVGAG